MFPREALAPLAFPSALRRMLATVLVRRRATLKAWGMVTVATSLTRWGGGGGGYASRLRLAWYHALGTSLVVLDLGRPS